VAPDAIFGDLTKPRESPARAQPPATKLMSEKIAAGDFSNQREPSV
jgi:hypothetical protein